MLYLSIIPYAISLKYDARDMFYQVIHCLTPMVLQYISMHKCYLKVHKYFILNKKDKARANLFYKWYLPICDL